MFVAKCSKNLVTNFTNLTVITDTFDSSPYIGSIYCIGCSAPGMGENRRKEGKKKREKCCKEERQEGTGRVGKEGREGK